MTEESFNKSYINITHLIQNEFDRNVNKYGSKINCRKGCSQCCFQIFKITLIDSFIIKKYLDTLPIEQVNNLKERTKFYIAQIKNNITQGDEFYVKPKFPCPALSENEECMIYAGRPVICRKFGPPIFDYKSPGKIFACELNFAEGEEITDDELIPNQTQIGKEWDMLKTEFNIKYNLRENASTTIAEAILNS